MRNTMLRKQTPSFQCVALRRSSLCAQHTQLTTDSYCKWQLPSASTRHSTQQACGALRLASTVVLLASD